MNFFFCGLFLFIDESWGNGNREIEKKGFKKAEKNGILGMFLNEGQMSLQRRVYCEEEKRIR